MNYKLKLLIIFLFFLNSCDQSLSKKNQIINIDQNDRYKNLGFALIYNDNLENIKKIESRSLSIFHRSLKKRSMVKITNPVNGNSLIAQVKSNKVKFSNFYNSILSPRIAEILELDDKEPYVEIVLISGNSSFVAKKAKTFEEESKVAEKAPIDGIQINDLNSKKINKKIKKNVKFTYSIKVADFYYRDTARLMLNRIKKQADIKNLSIIELSKTKYRLLIGPFDDIKSLQINFDKMNLFNFENLEILRNV
tara:strand:- start:110 stop:862 length:753 start_codon:yes stop_codon:yes gene_type:complete